LTKARRRTSSHLENRSSGEGKNGGGEKASKKKEMRRRGALSKRLQQRNLAGVLGEDPRKKNRKRPTKKKGEEYSIIGEKREFCKVWLRLQGEVGYRRSFLRLLGTSTGITGEQRETEPMIDQCQSHRGSEGRPRGKRGLKLKKQLGRGGGFFRHA